MIDGAIVKKLTVLPDERGRLMEILRNDDPFFEKFGQAYMSTAYPGVVKAWHYHKIQTDHFVTLHGMMKIVLYDARQDSPTHGDINEFFTGIHNPALIRVPVGVYHGLQCVGEHEALLLNIPSEVYNYDNPDEHRVPADDPSVPYDWTRRAG